MSKIGRPREYRDKQHQERAEYMREWYARNKKRLMEELREDRAANPEKYRARDRARYEKDKARRIKLANKWKRNNPDKRRESLREWERRNPLAKAASTAVGKAIRSGKLERGPCEVCGVTKRIQAHHDDYSKPLSVRWLCIDHHAEHHKRKREAERKSSV